ncbi:predicted protein [Naegleria gruberi]|uniref:Predicted protein n=1 Tax=Naegleria gruberi TaxID=5762 RepID=D2VCH4_NAEGR|nr:uncharacterized protein NAEGRDRAFT_66572 [Naegleria gruberi]EFC45311.1 predicted protein [Naegleria gruberi]|eukprot:XP_002678055.1 predicted protein [Naegleria gruberi strain NEG-M]
MQQTNGRENLLKFLKLKTPIKKPLHKLLTHISGYFHDEYIDGECLSEEDNDDPNRCNDCPTIKDIVPIFRSLPLPVQVHMFTNFVVNLLCLDEASVTGREFVDRRDLNNNNNVRLDYEDMFSGLPEEKVKEKEILSCFIVYLFFKRYAMTRLGLELEFFFDSENVMSWNDREMFSEVFKELNLDYKELRKVSKEELNLNQLKKSKDGDMWYKLVLMIHEEFFEDLSDEAKQFREKISNIVFNEMDRAKSNCEEYTLLQNWHTDIVSNYAKIYRKNQPHKDLLKLGIVCQTSSLHNSASQDKHVNYFWDNIKNVDNLGNVQMGLFSPSPRAYFTFCCYGAKMKQHNYDFGDPKQKLRGFFAMCDYHRKHSLFINSFCVGPYVVEFKRFPILSHFNHEKCKMCNTKGKLCQACKSVRYCSLACQKSDWNSHKQNCKIYQLFL